MQKIAALMFTLLMATIVPCLAQTNKPVYLTNYTITKSNDAVGYVRTTAGDIKSITLTGTHAAAFKVTKDHQLTVKQNKLAGSQPWYDVVLTVKTSTGESTDTVRLVVDTFIRNKVIAHRGAWKNTGATENSIAALNHAIALGCEGSEFDVHLSADGVPMINHDPTIQGVSIAKSNLSDLLNIKLSNGETLPTLEAYLATGMKQTKTKLILEIKSSELGKESSITLTRKVVALVEKMHAQAWVDYISFDYEVCQEVMTLAPYAKAAYLKGDKSPAELAADKFYGLDYHFSILRKNPEWTKEAHDKKLTVNVWTVNDKASLQEMLDLNVDFITTNEPELLLSMIGTSK